MWFLLEEIYWGYVEGINVDMLIGSVIFERDGVYLSI